MRAHEVSGMYVPSKIGKKYFFVAVLKPKELPFLNVF
jgi:hypothetical protein